MSLSTDIAKLQLEVSSADDSVAQRAADELAELHGDVGLDILISMIGSGSSRQQDLAAHAIEKRPDQRALEPLLTAIFKPANKGYNAELVYALQSFDCSMKLVEVFEILFYQSYESKWYAASILDEQDFEFTADDLHRIRHKWERVLQNPSLCPDFDLTRKEIQDRVDDFMTYMDGETKSAKG